MLRRAVSGDRGYRQRLVDGTVQSLVERLLPSLAQVLAHAVEDDDGVVEGVTENGKKSGDYGQRYLEVHQLEKRNRGEHVVTGRDHCRGGEPPLESDRQVDEGNQERQQNGDDGAALELLSDGAGDRFSADYLQLGRAEFLFQDALDGDGDVFGASRLRRNLRRILCPNRELAIGPELLDLGATNSRLIQRGADLGDVGGL